jgi:hypothetical protein
MPNRKRLALATTATMLTLPAAALALPGSALAAGPQAGVVLSAHGRSIQVVGAAREVAAFTAAGALPRLHTGSRIAFRADGRRIDGVRVTGSRSRLSYYASVVRITSERVALRLSDGKTISFSPRQVSSAAGGRRAHAAAGSSAGLTVTVRLQPHTPVLVSETIGRGGALSLSITVQAASKGASGGSGGNSGSGGKSGSGGSSTPKGDETATGIVTDVESATFGILTDGGVDDSFRMSASALANVGMETCDVVTVAYHTSGSSLVADTVSDTDSSDAGQCDSDGTYYATEDETGPITAVSSTSVTLDTSDQGSMTFALDPSDDLGDGYLVGDVVDVTYEPVPDSVNFATDVEYVESDSTGVVTAVSDGSLTITDDSTGQPDVFTADPSDGVFTGVQTGDEVDVTWHQAAGNQMVADAVDDETDDSGGDGGS